MLDASDGELESMAVLVPVNRVVENVIIYLTDPSKCDPRFTKIVQSSSAALPV